VVISFVKNDTQWWKDEEQSVSEATMSAATIAEPL
jgi:hypothetical protein